MSTESIGSSQIVCNQIHQIHFINRFNEDAKIRMIDKETREDVELASLQFTTVPILTNWRRTHREQLFLEVSEC
jgi:hypothetical protein